MSATVSEVQRVGELLARAREASGNAAMWFRDVCDLCGGDTDEQWPAAEAARLVGLAHAAGSDAEYAVEEAKRAAKALLGALLMAEEEHDEEVLDAR